MNLQKFGFMPGNPENQVCKHQNINKVDLGFCTQPCASHKTLEAAII